MVRLGAGVGRPWAEGIARARSPPFQYGCVARGGARVPCAMTAREAGRPARRPPWPEHATCEREQGRQLLAGGAGVIIRREMQDSAHFVNPDSLHQTADSIMVYSCAEPLSEPRGMLDWMRPSVKQPTRPRLSSQDPNNGDTPLHRAVKMALGNVLGEEPLREISPDL